MLKTREGQTATQTECHFEALQNSLGVLRPGPWKHGEHIHLSQAPVKSTVNDLVVGVKSIQAVGALEPWYRGCLGNETFVFAIRGQDYGRPKNTYSPLRLAVDITDSII